MIGGVAWSTVGDLLLRHLYLAGLPLLLGLVISLPLGWLATRYRWLAPPMIAGTGLLYTIPSLALFILLPLLLGTRVLDDANVLVAMTLYAIALLTRTVADGLGSVPVATRQAATAMGYGELRRTLVVDLPLAVPVITAGLRVAAVSNVSIVSVAALIGVSQLGQLFTEGFNRNDMGPILVGIGACVGLALVLDAGIALLSRVLTPWLRAGAA
ncbi:L-proline glycine betaine ABC transport system permease protein ProW [Serinicoccus hydrothermalis]|uniref:L-proline glycine betaine ABC transport system permease protein ProW n=1 Tax=Serinicoccus hydrothermalis TaxID=1758689 RepID=A0A1B1NCG4_9MICO|nr:ABC transporter permease subunit [Serinicoccus hydrothermalis]ANS79129.1 L-proline glycine betaine ABC transport system permease protein ProW [Serinicoccus hydrothermalis]